MKHGYVTAACRVGVLAGIAALAACAGTGEGNDGRNGVRIVSGAYPDGEGTRVAYEYDGEAHRVVWSEGDALRVAAFAEGARVADGGRLWSRFDMVADGGFDASYMLFAGDALVPPDAGPFSQQRLYALYPAGMLVGDADDSLLFPAVQAYSPDAFDTEAVLMVAAPVEAEIPQRVRCIRLRSDSLTIRVTCGCRRRICRRPCRMNASAVSCWRAWRGFPWPAVLRCR